MSQSIVVYCDESCHLEADNQEVMVLGAIWCSEAAKAVANQRIKEIKRKHKVSDAFEIKWTKVSPGKIDFYLDLLDYFFDNEELHFRGVVIPNKSALDHSLYSQTHDQWYYKMYFNLLKAILDNRNTYNVYLDIKDSVGGKKVDKLHDVLSHQMYDFERRIVQKIQLIRSHESSLLQIADLISGLVMYENRTDAEKRSEAKCKLVARAKERSGYSLKRNTLLNESKFNLFIWHRTDDGGQ